MARRRDGETFVWMSAAGLAGVLLLVVAVLVIVLANGLGFFWPSRLEAVRLVDGGVLLGQPLESEDTPEGGRRTRYKIGNRDLYGQDFRWVDLVSVEGIEHPVETVAVERLEYGHFYGTLQGVDGGKLLDFPAEADPMERYRLALAAMAEPRATLDRLGTEMSAVNREAQALTERRARWGHSRQGDPGLTADLTEIDAAVDRLRQRFEGLRDRHAEIEADLRLVQLRLADIEGREIKLPLIDVLNVWWPNAMSNGERLAHYLDKVRKLLLDEPRESNTEGGIFPAIFGTVMMVLLMSLFSVPFGVIAAVYLREYAREGRFVRLVRIAVNNLAGVPSIVYGVFGLGFFVYTAGSGIDELLFGYRLPTPTFGTGGILWASLTLALLTVPVVIVSTEEALSAIPKEIREGSLALGATKLQTLLRILIPMSTPGIMTGLVLSMARAAGEVAPLMLTGAVKLAPELPLDSVFPYLHLDRKFMHLGFHIYDLAFQSPNVEAVLPMVYVTTMLLLGIVILLSAAAILLRERMRRRYTVGTF